MADLLNSCELLIDFDPEKDYRQLQRPVEASLHWRVEQQKYFQLYEITNRSIVQDFHGNRESLKLSKEFMEIYDQHLQLDRRRLGELDALSNFHSKVKIYYC